MELQNIRHQKAAIIIGKNQLSDGMVRSIKEHVKKNGMVKIKILRSALSVDYSKEDLMNELITLTNYAIIEKRGNTIIISNSHPTKKK